MQIICDGCSKVVSCGVGKDREHAHVVRTRLRDAGWRIDRNGDICAACQKVEADVSYRACCPICGGKDGCHQ